MSRRLVDAAARGEPDRLEADDLGEGVEVAVVVQDGGRRVLRGRGQQVVDERQSLGAGGTMGQGAHRVLRGANDGVRQRRGPEHRKLFRELVEDLAVTSAEQDLEACDG